MKINEVANQYSMFCYNAYFEKVNLFKCNCYIRKQHDHKANFKLLHGSFYL